MKGNSRLNMVIKGSFLSYLYKGYKTSLCLFHDESGDILPVGVSNSIDIELGEPCTAITEVYGRTIKQANQDVRYSLRMQVIDIIEE